MGFFELPERDPEEDDLEPDDPYDIPRAAPWIAGIVPLELVVARSDEAAVVASRIAAHPDGFELTLNSYIRPSASRRRLRRHHPMWSHDLDPSDPIPDTFLRFGLAWPDGGRATNLDRWGRPWHDADATEPEHSLEEQGGGGSDDEYTEQYWCRPLPTEGELHLVVEWPAYGIPETSAALDAALFTEAAARARPVWEDDVDTPSHVSRSAVLRALRRPES